MVVRAPLPKFTVVSALLDETLMLPVTVDNADKSSVASASLLRTVRSFNVVTLLPSMLMRSDSA